MSAQLHVLILAAGDSSRMGTPKQLLPIVGRPALAHVVGNATAVAGTAVSVILGAHAAAITPLLQHSSATVLINRQWQEGIAASIRCGINSLSSGCDAALILLGDQAAVSAGDLRRLIAAWNGEDSIIAASVYQGQFGVPAIFPRAVFSELLQLRGDQGAKIIIHRHASRVTQIPMPSAALDLDTHADIPTMVEAVTQQEHELLL